MPLFVMTLEDIGKLFCYISGKNPSAEQWAVQWIHQKNMMDGQTERQRDRQTNKQTDNCQIKIRMSLLTILYYVTIDNFVILEFEGAMHPSNSSPSGGVWLAFGPPLWAECPPIWAFDPPILAFGPSKHLLDIHDCHDIQFFTCVPNFHSLA